MKEKPCGLFIQYVFAWGFCGGACGGRAGKHKHMHASCATTWTTFLYCNLFSWNPLPLMAILSLSLDSLRVGKLSKRIFVLFCFVLYTENVNAVGNLTYKDNVLNHQNTWLWSVLFYLAWAWMVHGGCLKKMVNEMVSANMWVSRDWLHLCCYHGHRCLSSAWHTMWWRGAGEGNQPSATHLSPSQHHPRGGGLWFYSTLMMYVNTNVKMQKHILSFYYYTWKKNPDFLS